MTFSLILPGVIGLAVALFASVPRWLATPRHAVRLLALSGALAAGTAFAVVTATVVGFVGRTSFGSWMLGWCPRLTPDHEVGITEGSVALVALAFMVGRVHRVLVAHRQVRAEAEGDHLRIVDTAEPVAYAVPGDPGCVVISRSLLRSLNASERQVVIAHERAHLDQKHHRYLLTGALAAAVVPLLEPLMARLRLATERCADEVAVRSLGGDRRAVAETIGRVALAAPRAASMSIGFLGGGSVPLRVQALLGEPRGGTTTASSLLGSIVVAAVVAAAAVQVHHLYNLVVHVCMH